MTLILFGGAESIFAVRARVAEKRRAAGLDRGSLKGIARERIRERRGSRPVARAIIRDVSRDVVLIEK